MAEFKQALEPQDIQATLTALTAHSIANDINHYSSNTKAIYVCGGGAHNSYLMRLLQQRHSKIIVTTTDEIGLHPDWVEATAFAWLAKQTLANKLAICLRSPVLSGQQF